MTFNSLQTVLGGLQNQYQRREQHQLQHILDCWLEVVGPVVAAQTRPLNVYRGVLKVATSSAAWAQNLVFERQRILEKLTVVSAVQITDIRFSPGQWHTTKLPPAVPGEQYQQELWQAHPSRLRHGQPVAQSVSINPPDPEKDALLAFQQWAAKMKARSRQLPLCPECKCPTPIGELQRWQVCAICITKQW
ncbi:MAG: DciA family protein [Leptolyngbyaceae cyanobacterium bins.349]|nr:DciA family protein [Leptolyngbyaceae cyanobacterium bins.349]